MINGTLIDTASFEDYFPELTWWERGVVFVYILVIVVVSTVGNTFVLIMSKDLKSVTKDSKGSLLLINIAFVDLMTNFFLSIPMLISTISRKWILGSGYCFLDAFFETYFGILEIMFVFLISLHRTIVIKFPFKQQRLMTTKKVYTVIILTYLLAMWPCVMRTVAPIQIMGYVASEVHCDNLQVASTGPWVASLRVSLVIFGFGPVVITVLLYFWMMWFAMSKAEGARTASGRHRIKNGGGTQMRPPNKALQTVSLIVGIYLLSIFLLILIMAIRIKFPDVIPKRVHLASICLWLLNTAVNPIIYVYNNPMFRAHLKRLLLRKTENYAANSSSSLAQSLRRRITQQSVVNFHSSPMMMRSPTSASLSVTYPNNVLHPKRTDGVVKPLSSVSEVNSSVVIKNRLTEQSVVSNGTGQFSVVSSDSNNLPVVGHETIAESSA